MPVSNGSLLTIRGLRVEFLVTGSAGTTEGADGTPPSRRWKVPGRQVLTAVDGVDLAVRDGEILGLVGESGSGKTVFSLALLRLIQEPGRITAGEVVWNGRDLLGLREEEMRKIRGREMAMIFQNPQLSLNPARRVGSQLVSTLRLHHRFSAREAHQEAMRWLGEVRVPDPERVMQAYPYQLSGGLCQRLMLAMVLSCRPRLLIADEPTAALDVTIQAQIMNLLLELRERYHMAILLVSHDLGVIARMCDRIAVMYLGRIVEVAEATALYDSPLHPYTQALLRALPVADPHRREKVEVLEGEPPSQLRLPRNSCRFLGRCPVAVERCHSIDPPLVPVNGSSHWVACVHFSGTGVAEPAGAKKAEKEQPKPASASRRNLL